MTTKSTIRIRITNQQIDDMMTTALEGGINYWCGQAIVAEQPKHSIEWASEAISRGGVLKLWDFEEEKWHLLDRTKFMQGVEKAINDDRGLSLNDFDSVDADRVIQYAIFGEQVYA